MPILDGHIDNIAPGDCFYAPVPIPAHDIRTHGRVAVVNHDHCVGTYFGGFLAQLRFHIIAKSGRIDCGVHDDFTQASPRRS